MTPPECVVLLRAELVRAAERRAPRARSLLVVAVALGAMTAGLLATRPAPADAEVHIEVGDGRLAITLDDVAVRPLHLEAVLRGLGLPVTVTAVPVGPSQVGRLVGTAARGDTPPELLDRDAGRATFAGFSVPLDWTGSLELLVGRPAAPGEHYATYADAFAPGEPLACRRLVGRTASAAVLALGDVDVDVRFQPVTEVSTGPLSRQEVVVSPQRGWLVAAAAATDATHVVVHLVPPERGSLTPSPPASRLHRCAR